MIPTRTLIDTLSKYNMVLVLFSQRKRPKRHWYSQSSILSVTITKRVRSSIHGIVSFKEDPITAHSTSFSFPSVSWCRGTHINTTMYAIVKISEFYFGVIGHKTKLKNFIKENYRKSRNDFCTNCLDKGEQSVQRLLCESSVLQFHHMHAFEF